MKLNIKEEEKKYQKILNENNFICDNFQIELSEDGWLEIRPFITYSEENLNKIKRLLKAETFEVGFDGHMEEPYMVFKVF